MTPLYGHTNESNAYLVDDYPYGRIVRCRIRYWIESHPNKGYRFVSQTEHPTTKRWNKPKKSTYSLLAACMYLDEVKHVQCRHVTEYSTAEQVRAFVSDFPGADMSKVRPWVVAKVFYIQQCLEGAHFIVNGKAKPWSEDANARHRAELAVWRDVERELKKEASPQP